MEIDRRAFIASLGGTAAVGMMDSEAKAYALEHWMEDQLDQQAAAQGRPERQPFQRAGHRAPSQIPVAAARRA